jgi:predicted MFS family arabinose efflux permease
LRHYTGYVVALLTVVNTFNYMDRMALSVLLPQIKADLRLADSELGLLTGLAFFVFYALCGVPIARWADRGSRRNLIALTLTLWSVMTAIVGASRSFLHLFLARVGVGVGEAGGLPAAQSLLCDYVPPERRAGAYAVHSFGLYAGMMVGMTAAGILGEHIGWRWTFLALGAPGLALALIVQLTLREPQRGTFDTPQDRNAISLTEALAFLWSCNTYRWLVLFLTLNGFVVYGLNQWWPSLYLRSFGLAIADVGLYLGLAIGVGSGLGLLTGGALTQRMPGYRAATPLVTGAVLFACSVPLALTSLLVHSARLSLLLVFASFFLWCIPGGAIVASLYSVVPPGMRATAGSVSTLFSSVLGFGLGPFCVGSLSDLFGPILGAESLRYALMLPVAVLPAIALVLYAASRALPSDVRAVAIPY